MSRLRTEFERLYAPLVAERGPAAGQAPDLMGPQGEVRALVLDIGRPVNWELVAPVWRDVQADLDLPAPAIAISGAQGFQLWFSLAHPVPASEARSFLDGLQRRYLAGLPPARVQAYPVQEAGAWRQAAPVPGLVSPDQWSAFVAPGLAPVFAETPWLDFPPNEEGQADLLRGLDSITPAAWQDALQRLGVQAGGTPAGSGGLLRTAGEGAGAGTRLPNVPATGALAPTAGTLAPAPSPGMPSAASVMQDPRSFLLQVMNDERVALPLRIDAAKALLPYMGQPGA